MKLWPSGEVVASIARFGTGQAAPQIALRCDRATSTITLERAGAADGPVNMTIATSTITRPVLAEPRAYGLTAAFSPRDSLLDAIAFSRGRFAVEAQGIAPLYLPSWPELSRVIEDCRPG